MNHFASCRWLVRIPLVALVVAGGFLALGGGNGQNAFGQPPISVQGPAGNAYGSGVGTNPTNPYLPGQQLMIGPPVQPAQASRPAGWPGGPSDDPPPQPKRRRRYAAPFNSTAAAGTGTPAAATGATTGAVATTAAAGPAQAAAAAPPAMPGVATAGYPAAAYAAPGSAPTGVQPVSNVTTENAPSGTAATYAAPVASALNAAGSAPAAPGDPSAGAGPGSGTQAAPVLVASSMAAAVDLSVEEKHAPVPFGLPTTFGGAEIIAWVGPEVILASDVLPDANRHLQKILERAPQPPPADEIERARKLYMSKFLEHVIDTKLVIVEGRRSLPKEAWGKIEKQFNEQFDKEYLKKMIESEECRSRTELDLKLRKQGSSLEALRRQAMENSFAQHWIDEKVKDDHEITHEEMHAYYRAHMAGYETPARARWEHLMVRFDKFESKEAAWQALAGWGREIQAGAKFSDVATAHSQDISATDGGVHTWTNKDSLVSQVLDNALFTLPVGELSQILEDKRGFHIIRVVERDELTVTPFTDAQPEIKKKIHDERVGDKKQAYKNKLRKKIPVWNIFEEAAGIATVAPR
ncbi:MAG TPA: peptidyl-prolyl cis-trans isomerase [Pirellulales bacterium]|nr:peptidyl-prolyl cis-trans isomerase [Pirellulales bacterium]